MRQVCPFPLVDSGCLPSNGATGGIWLLWDTSKILILQFWVRTFSIFVRGRLRDAEEEWMITSVYGHCIQNRKLEFFHELDSIRSS